VSVCHCCRDNDIEESDLEMYFTCDSETLGKYETFELKPGGEEIQVSESNKIEYIRYSGVWYLYRLVLIFVSIISLRNQITV